MPACPEYASVRQLKNLYLQHEAGLLADELWANGAALVDVNR